MHADTLKIRGLVHLPEVVPVRVLTAAGLSRHAINRAIASGDLVRVCRGWVARPGADPHLMTAAITGTVLSCVTQAARLGLWDFGDPLLHLAAREGSGSVVRDRALVHWARPPVPRHPDQLVDSIENVLAAVADCQPFERALVIWEAAANKHLVNKPAMARLRLRPTARALLDALTPFSDSGLETLVRWRLRFLRLPIMAQAHLEGRPVDFLIGDRLVLQIDGGHHVGAQRDADIEHDRRLMLLGYYVIRVSYKQVTEQWLVVQEQIMHAVAQGLHLAS
ncbi:very-short-patch-repair endonuclease [Branchiibius hedensis]|uniref:Very-short-patch-repair endonuclease n=1 Tax=Branchiibius hedensis TaxID=672460 RepID=A0A2Y9BU06_9MICO|nr:type IV toxin-antitoxin system AbiEi family antitoxin domain-containing protein [Branchiibius hedensis]PWJ26120.1 very-short-patch-repair endonuclease [Branchiibius hedensis]SSA34932.1 Very-short-patch-repair endonuclease [Branchiibius hedensis]